MDEADRVRDGVVVDSVIAGQEGSGVALALDGAPGIFSARWAGETKDFTAAMTRIERLLQERGAASPAQRKAHFVSALCVAWPDGHLEQVEARADGTLVWPPRGSAGFGYDPMFIPEGYTETFGELSHAVKYAIDHRARAFQQLVAECFS